MTAKHKADWFYFRTGCTGCAKAAGFLKEGEIEIVEQVPASRKLQVEDAKALLADASLLIAAKGRKVNEFDLSAGATEDAVTAMLGPTGNLRAPTVKVGTTLLVGFDESSYQRVFS